MTKCYDCGCRVKATKSTLRPFCKKCVKRHNRYRKTNAIIRHYEEFQKSQLRRFDEEVGR